MSTPPDYGEPWQKSCAEMYIIDRHGDAGCIVGNRRERSITCVNACQGMTDPAAEIQAMRDAIKEAISQLDKYINFLRSCDGDTKNCKRVITKLQPFIK